MMRVEIRAVTGIQQYVRLIVWACVLATLGACSSPLVKAPEVSPARTQIISIAGAQVGSPYKYDSADRYGFDASGLVFYSYKRAGFEVPRDAQGQLRAGNNIAFYAAQPADLLFYKLGPKQAGTVSGLHVGIYMGNGEMVHAPLNRDEVVLETIDNPYWLQRLVSAVQILP